MGIDERLVAGSSESQDRVEGRHQMMLSPIPMMRFREIVLPECLRCGIVFLSQLHADGSRRSYAHTGPKGGGEVHEGKVMARPEMAMAPAP